MFYFKLFNPDYHAWIISDFLVVVWLSLIQRNISCTLIWSYIQYLCQVFSRILANTEHIFIALDASSSGIFLFLRTVNNNEYINLNYILFPKFPIFYTGRNTVVNYSNKNVFKVCRWKISILNVSSLVSFWILAILSEIY